MIIYINYFILLLAVLTLTGCFSGDEDVHDFVDKIKKTAAGKVNELPTEKAAVNAEFTATDLRSPFVVARRSDKIGSLSQIEGQQQGGGAQPEQQPRPDAKRKREFLEQFPLDSFDMVGSISKGDYIWGLLKDKNGLVYPVKPGDYIGENAGYITAVTENKIEIEETVPNGDGGWKHQMTALSLGEAAAQKEGSKQ